MSGTSRLSRLYRGLTSFNARPGQIPVPQGVPEPMRSMFDLLRAYYENNSLYDQLAQFKYESGLTPDALKALRNPAFRIVEFYVAHVWSGRLAESLKIKPTSERAEQAGQALIDAIHQIWTWSNLEGNKALGVRWAAMYGNLFIKVAERAAPLPADRRVYLQFLDPHLISDVAHDERGFIVYVRIDAQIDLDVETRERTLAGNMQDGRSPVPGSPDQEWLTEVWDKRNNLMRQWRHDKGPNATLADLGDPFAAQPITTFGIDFIPLVHVQFRDVGDVWRAGAYAHILDKIDEANRLATRLHQILFRYGKALWAMAANQVSGDSRPTPGPRLPSGSNSGTVNYGGEDWVSLPGMATITPLVAQIDYASHLAALKDHMRELEDDAPELAWYRVRDMGEISGKAIRLSLGDAIARAEEARGALNTGLIRATQMALTIGQLAGVIPTALGAFVDGAFDHEYDDGDVIPISEQEHWETVNQQLDAYIKLIELGWSQRQIMREFGLSEAEIDAMEQERSQEDDQALANGQSQMLNALRAFDSGQRPALEAGAPAA